MGMVMEAAADGDRDHHHHLVAKVFTRALLLWFDVELLCKQNVYSTISIFHICLLVVLIAFPRKITRLYYMLAM